VNMCLFSAWSTIKQKRWRHCFPTIYRSCWGSTNMQCKIWASIAQNCFSGTLFASSVLLYDVFSV